MERGLKPLKGTLDVHRMKVAPFTGAWIETFFLPVTRLDTPRYALPASNQYSDKYIADPIQAIKEVFL